MNKNIPPQNYLFMLAYAYSYGWDYLKQELEEQDVEGFALFEVMTLMLVKWSQKLISHELYRSFKQKRKQTQRLRGKVCFGENIKNGQVHSTTLTCEYDELSFDILENRILFATLDICKKKLAKEYRESNISNRTKSRNKLVSNLGSVYRRLSSAVSLVPLQREDFSKITYNRVNQNYEPVIDLCKLIFDSVLFGDHGDRDAFDVPEDKMYEIFEKFLRNYLDDQFESDYTVKSERRSDWVKKSDGVVNHIPNIQPDIVIRKSGEPVFIIDAKFYKSAVYDSRYSNKENYKTHSQNLYQIISYTRYYNCDGLLVYAQTERGGFNEMVKISDEFYDENRDPQQEFGFYTLDLSGDVGELKNSVDELVEYVGLETKVNY